MRAITGAIITAGALIGLGLAALGVGTRYSNFSDRDPTTMRPTFIHFKEIDTALMLIVVILLIAVVIGVGATFVGLAYHHERRLHERLHVHHHDGAGRPAITP